MNQGVTPGRGERLLVAAAIFAAGVAVYGSSFDNGFSLDDFNWLERARFSRGLIGFALTPEPGQLLAPIPKAVFWLLQQGGGTAPIPYRVVIFAFHLLNAWLVYRLGSRVFADGRAAAVAGVAFAAHPAGGEALFWVAAFFHPIVTTLFLLATLTFMRGLDPAHRTQWVWSFLIFTLGLLSKATFYPCLLVLAAAAWQYGDPSSSPARRLAPVLPFGVLTALALAVNWRLELGRSYLVTGGAWGPGAHALSNLQEYLVRLSFPLRHWPGALGSGLGDGVAAAARWALPPLVILGLVRGSRGVRFSLVFLLASLLPVLPFVGEPTSRYAYLPSAPLSLVAGHLISRGWRAWEESASSTTRRALAPLVLAGLLVGLSAEARRDDRAYEHRENRFAQLSSDARRLCPELPESPKVVILDLPTFAVDRGIHLAAALRLAFERPGLELIVVDSKSAGPPPDGDCVLAYRNERLLPTSRQAR